MFDDDGFTRPATIDEVMLLDMNHLKVEFLDARARRRVMDLVADATEDLLGKLPNEVPDEIVDYLMGLMDLTSDLLGVERPNFCDETP